jgi:heterodisulfide reductase subunit A
MEVDLVVLCTAAIPHRENRKLGGVLGVELDEFGFFADKNMLTAPVESSKPGIYVCGSCHGPRDIPESVAEASATAAKAAEDAARAEVKQ